MQLETTWTPAKVAECLVGAYRLLPSRPVMSSAAGFVVQGEGVVEAFSWPQRFVIDQWDRRVLMTWARCIATGESVRERYAGLQWPRAKAERRRRSALVAIATGLNSCPGCN